VNHTNAAAADGSGPLGELINGSGSRELWNAVDLRRRSPEQLLQTVLDLPLPLSERSSYPSIHLKSLPVLAPVFCKVQKHRGFSEIPDSGEKVRLIKD
jgi:hypothetical protein